MDSTVLQPPGNYPDDWVRTDFDHFATLQRGKDLTRDHFRNGEVPVAGSNGIIGYHDTANVKAPGITVGRSGSVGKVTFYHQDFWAHNTALFVKDFHGNVPAFIAFFLDFLRLGRFGSGASVPTLDRNVFRTLPIVIPHPCEQRKIAAVLRLVQRAIEQQERLIALTTELKKALLHKLFTEGLCGESQKQTEIGPVPESWEIKAIQELGLDIGDGNYSTKYPKKDDFTTKGVPFIRANNLVDGRLVWDDMRYISLELHGELTKGHLKKNDVCLVTRGNIGQIAFVTDDFVGANMNAQLVRLNGGDAIDGKFLYYALSHSASQKQLRSLQTGTALQQLPLGKLKFVRLPLPAHDEQIEIANTLWLVDVKRDIVLRKHKAFETLFRKRIASCATVSRLKG